MSDSGPAWAGTAGARIDRDAREQPLHGEREREFGLGIGPDSEPQPVAERRGHLRWQPATPHGGAGQRTHEKRLATEETWNEGLDPRPGEKAKDPEKPQGLDGEPCATLTLTGHDI